MSDEDRRPSIFVVDDDDVFRRRMARALGERGFDVREAGSCAEALALAAGESPELALIDLRLPGGSGLDVIRELKALDATTNIVVLTGYGSIATALEAVRLGALSYLSKPADADDVLRAFGQSSSEDSVPLQVPSLARVEWEHIQRVLADCGGNVSQAARLLGIHRRSLQRKLGKRPGTR